MNSKVVQIQWLKINDEPESDVAVVMKNAVVKFFCMGVI